MTGTTRCTKDTQNIMKVLIFRRLDIRESTVVYNHDYFEKLNAILTATSVFLMKDNMYLLMMYYSVTVIPKTMKAIHR